VSEDENIPKETVVLKPTQEVSEVGGGGVVRDASEGLKGAVEPLTKTDPATGRAIYTERGNALKEKPSEGLSRKAVTSIQGKI